jgi:hypothetical protein
MASTDIYFWRDTYDCGHTVIVETYVDFDRSGRMEEPVVCRQCEPRKLVNRVAVERTEKPPE